MQPPTLMGRPPLSDAASISSSWLRTIVGHWLFPTSKTFNGFRELCDSPARPEAIIMPANNSVTAKVIDFIFMGNLLVVVTEKLRSVQRVTGTTWFYVKAGGLRLHTIICNGSKTVCESASLIVEYVPSSMWIRS